MLRTSTIRRFSFINSRAHEGRDTPPGNGRRTATQFQLTRPRGARHFVFAPGPILKPFQLTRPRGARQHLVAATARARDVSTHAPTRGATFCFCSRPDSQTVSTHAPARGATAPGSCHSAGTGRFNSRAREGRDGTWNMGAAVSLAFQLTRPRGARPKRLSSRLTPPRVSTHAPARGATFLPPCS